MSSYPVAVQWASELPIRLTRSRQGHIALLVAVMIWGWVDVRQRGYPYPENPDKHKSDLTVYTEAGAAFFDGRPPYSVCNVRGCTYVYPPLLALLLAPLHPLPMQDQVTVWFLLSLAMCWGCYCESRRIVAALCGRNDRPKNSFRLSSVLLTLRVRKPRHAERDQYTSYESFSSADPSTACARWFPWLGAAAAAAAVLPTLNCLQRGQVTVVLLYPLLLGLRLVLCSRTAWGWIGGGIALALPISVKVIPALPVGLLLLMQLVATLRSRREPGRKAQRPGVRLAGSALGVGFGLLLFLLFVPAALIGWNANLKHLDTWSHAVLSGAEHSTTTPGFQNDTHSARNQCLGNAVYRLGNFASYALGGGPEDPLVDEEHMPPRLMDSPVVDWALLYVRVALLLAVCVAAVRLACDGGGSPVWRTARTVAAGGRSESDLLLHNKDTVGQSTTQAVSLAAGFGLACVAMLVLSPVARGHYFMLWVPAVLFVPLWLDRHGMPRAAATMAVVPAVLTILHYILLPVAGRMGLLGIGSTCWLMAACVLVNRAGRSASRLATIVAETAPPGHFPTIGKAA